VDEIDDPSHLPVGAVLFHPAFGYATVHGQVEGGVSLLWDPPAVHLPAEVNDDAMRTSWLRVAEGSLVHGAIVDAETTRRRFLEQPSDALVALLHETDAEWAVRDLMDWLIARRLFTAKTFVRWWGTEAPNVRNDPPLSLDGDRLALRREDGDAPVLAQIARDVAQASRVAVPEDGAEASGAPFRWPDVPVPLNLLGLDARGLLRVAHAAASALADAHTRAQVVAPYTGTVIVAPEGVRFLDGDPDRSPRRPGEISGSETDVYAVATLLVEAMVGRTTPAGLEAGELLPFLRHRLPDLPPSALGPLADALRPRPSHRPSATAWRDAWAAAIDAERARRTPAPLGARALSVGYDTHVGRVKVLKTQVNQDALYVGQRGSELLVVVADGISVADAGRGEQASHLAVSAIGRLWENLGAQGDPLSDPTRFLDAGLALANRLIAERAQKAVGGSLVGRMPMGTTCTVALCRGDHVHLAWLGDSRAFLLSPRGGALLTADDNVSGERFVPWSEGKLAAWQPTAHGLTRFLGHFNTDWEPTPLPAHHDGLRLLPDERLLLCTDGVTDYLTSHEADLGARLAALAGTAPLDEAAHAVLHAANRGGGGDNITVAVLGRTGA
jgi:serine/threonine protein phosphatase PrpC